MFRVTMIALAMMGGPVAMPAAAAVIVSVNQAGSAAANLSGYNFYVDNLDSSTNGLPTLAFSGSSITGTRTDGFTNIGGANVYGGTGGTGLFATIQGGPSTYQLSQSVNYFGLWGSALDGNNSVELYDNDTLLGSYALQSVLQSSADFNSGYYGNPFAGGNAGELYAFFNFQSDTAFNRIQLVQDGGGGFEFDNLTVGSAVVSTAPEPATWAMMLLGFGAIGMTLRKRRLQSTMPRRRAADHR